MLNNTLGDHTVVSCGSVTGQLYLSKLSQSSTATMLTVSGK